MASRSLALVLAGLGLTACAEDDPPVTELHVVANERVLLDAPVEPYADVAQYRWEVSAEPAQSTVVITSEDPVTAFTPDVRGTYGIERYFAYRLGEELTHRFVVTVDGIPPFATFTAPATATVGMRVPLFGSGVSAEHLAVQLTWRLAARPAGSTAMLESLDTPTTGFTPDVAGDYTVELTAFDGELYGAAPAAFTIHAQ